MVKMRWNQLPLVQATCPQVIVFVFMQFFCPQVTVEHLCRLHNFHSISWKLFRPDPWSWEDLWQTGDGTISQRRRWYTGHTSWRGYTANTVPVYFFSCTCIFSPGIFASNSKVFFLRQNSNLLLSGNLPPWLSGPNIFLTSLSFLSKIRWL